MLRRLPNRRAGLLLWALSALACLHLRQQPLQLPYRLGVFLPLSLADASSERWPRHNAHEIGLFPRSRPMLVIQGQLAGGSEQTAIVEYLDKAAADIDAAIGRGCRQIEILRVKGGGGGPGPRLGLAGRPDRPAPAVVPFPLVRRHPPLGSPRRLRRPEPGWRGLALFSEMGAPGGAPHAHERPHRSLAALLCHPQAPGRPRRSAPGAGGLRRQTGSRSLLRSCRGGVAVGRGENASVGFTPE